METKTEFSKNNFTSVPVLAEPTEIPQEGAVGKVRESNNHRASITEGLGESRNTDSRGGCKTTFEAPFLLPNDYEEATCQWFDQRQREHDQPNAGASLPSEERNEEEL